MSTNKKPLKLSQIFKWLQNNGWVKDRTNTFSTTFTCGDPYASITIGDGYDPDGVIQRLQYRCYEDMPVKELRRMIVERENL